MREKKTTSAEEEEEDPPPGSPSTSHEIQAASKLLEGLRRRFAPLPAHVDNPAFVIRFLRARGHDMSRAAKMLHAHIVWRRDVHIDAVYDEMTRALRNIYDNEHDDHHDRSGLLFHELPEVLEIIPTFWHKTSKDGFPVWYQKLTDVSAKALWQITTHERYVRWQVLDYERLYRQLHPALLAQQSATTAFPCVLSIFDIDGISMMQWSSMQSVVLSGIRVASNNYPEMMGRLFIINAPLWMRCIWTLIRPLLDSKTASKIRIVSASDKHRVRDVLLEEIPVENLPSFLGGNSDDFQSCLRGAHPISTARRAGITPEIGPWVNADDIVDRTWMPEHRQEMCSTRRRLSHELHHEHHHPALLDRVEMLEKELGVQPPPSSKQCTLSTRIQALEVAAMRCGLICSFVERMEAAPASSLEAGASSTTTTTTTTLQPSSSPPPPGESAVSSSLRHQVHEEEHTPLLTKLHCSTSRLSDDVFFSCPTSPVASTPRDLHYNNASEEDFDLKWEDATTTPEDKQQSIWSNVVKAFNCCCCCCCSEA